MFGVKYFVLRGHWAHNFQAPVKLCWEILCLCGVSPLAISACANLQMLSVLFPLLPPAGACLCSCHLWRAACWFQGYSSVFKPTFMSFSHHLFSPLYPSFVNCMPTKWLPQFLLLYKINSVSCFTCCPKALKQRPKAAMAATIFFILLSQDHKIIISQEKWGHGVMFSSDNQMIILWYQNEKRQ